MEKENDRPLLIQLIVFVFQALFVILAIVFTILTFGIFLPDEEEKTRKKRKRPTVYDLHERLRVELKNKKARLAVINDRIVVLQQVKNKIAKREKRIFFGARLVIISLLLLLNCYYVQKFGKCNEPTIQHSFILGKEYLPDDKLIDIVVTFNGMILLLYSIPAYLLYGTVNRFTHVMKTKMIHFLSKKHHPTLSELKLLREEEQRLSREITGLAEQLAAWPIHHS